MPENWSVVGWQGVALRTPPDWNLVGVTGDEKKGYFRVDSPSSASLEVRWTALRQPPRDLAARAEEFLTALKKVGRKRKVAFVSKVRPRKPTEAEARHGGSSVGFTWTADRRAYGRVLYCGYCKRLVVAQVVGESERELSGASSQILGSICEHEKPGWNLWALYGFALPVPEAFRLQRHTLMSSFVELEFAARGQRLLVQRWGLAANQLLKKRSFHEWLERSYLPGVTGYSVESRPAEGEHEAAVFSGDRTIARTALALPMALWGRPVPRRMSGCAWFCAESNKLFAIRHYSRGNDDLSSRLRQEIACH